MYRQNISKSGFSGNINTPEIFGFEPLKEVLVQFYNVVSVVNFFDFRPLAKIKLKHLT